MDNFFKRDLRAVDYRMKAKENCDKQKDRLMVIFLIYLIVSIVVGIIDNATGSSVVLEDGTVQTTTWFSTVFSLITGGALILSFAEISKKVYLQNDVRNDDLLHGFKDFARSIKLYVLQSLYIALWTILLIVPGIVKAISYSMAFYIANDKKEFTAKECIDKSRQIMDGHKWEYFCLMLSYTGWILLSVLTFGVLLLWVGPRINQASYLFYLKVSGIGEKFEDALNETNAEEDNSSPFGNRE